MMFQYIRTYFTLALTTFKVAFVSTTASPLNTLSLLSSHGWTLSVCYLQMDGYFESVIFTWMDTFSLLSSDGWILQQHKYRLSYRGNVLTPMKDMLFHTYVLMMHSNDLFLYTYPLGDDYQWYFIHTYASPVYCPIFLRLVCPCSQFRLAQWRSDPHICHVSKVVTHDSSDQMFVTSAKLWHTGQ